LWGKGARILYREIQNTTFPACGAEDKSNGVNRPAEFTHFPAPRLDALMANLRSCHCLFDVNDRNFASFFGEKIAAAGSGFNLHKDGLRNAPKIVQSSDLLGQPQLPSPTDTSSFEAWRPQESLWV
jgi:hypothetical protein